MKIIILGFGAVGQGVARVLSMKKDYLKSNYDLNPQIVAVTDRSGAAIKENGLDTELLLKTKNETGKISSYPEYGVPGVSSLKVLEEVEYDCLVEVTPTDLMMLFLLSSIPLNLLSQISEKKPSYKLSMVLKFKLLLSFPKNFKLLSRWRRCRGTSDEILHTYCSRTAVIHPSGLDICLAL